MLSASMMVGARREREAAVAPTPTQRGVMALTRSALARRASASAAHWMVLAAISFPSVTATLPMYSEHMVMEAATGTVSMGSVDEEGDLEMNG